MHKKRVALILSLFALGVAGCGSDGEEDVSTVDTIPLSAPGDSTIDESIPTTTTPVETVPAPVTPPPATPPATPPPPPAEDSPQNDTPPQTPQSQQFEQFCNDNPGAC